MQNIEQLLDKKAEEYTRGDYQDRARMTQALKTVLIDEAVEPYEALDPVVRESLEMIMHKISRIVNGDPYEPDHWYDIAGYASLVPRQMEKR